MATQHQKVLGMAADACKDAAQCYKDREVYHAFWERVNLWLQNKERATGKLCSIRLQSLEVEKQIDKCKSLLAECHNYEPIIEQLKMKMDPLKANSTPEMVAELDHKYTDVETRFDELKNQLDEIQAQLHESLSVRNVYEGDMQKVNRWCKEMEIKCAGEPHLDCAVEVLKEQYKQYKTLSSTSKLFASLVTEIAERGELFLPKLYEADTFKLQQQLKSLRDRYDRVADVIEERVQSLQSALHTRGRVNDDIKEASDWLISVQEDLKRISLAVGPTTEDAENTLKQLDEIGESIKNVQPTIAQLNKAVEQLRNSGQDMEAEDILRITSQYEMLEDQVNQQRKKYGQAVILRQQYYAQLSELEAINKQCVDDIEAVGHHGVAMPTRLDRYKDVLEKIRTAEAILALMGDKAQQIMIEGTGDEVNSVSEELVAMKTCLDGLKRTVERQVKQCEQIQKKRESFESNIDVAIGWLEEKESQLGAHGPLGLNPEKVSIVYQKHQTLSRDALDKLETLKGKADVECVQFVELQEPVPLALTEKLEQIHSLEDSIKESITHKEQYLVSAKADRVHLEVSMKQISDWLSGAEDLLDSGYEGLDYETLMDTLSEHRDYFLEASMCQDEMEQVLDLSDRLVPTLDANDKETLHQLLNSTEQKLTDIVSASKRKQEMMVEKSTEWQEFQVGISQMMAVISKLEQDWDHVISIPLVSPTGIQQQTVQVKEFIDNLEKFRPQINELNEKSRDLEKLGNTGSRAAINRMVSAMNDQWAELVANTETKQISLQDLDGQWEEYSCLLHAVEIVLNEAEDTSSLLDMEMATSQQLMAEIEATRELHDNLECTQPKISMLKKCGQNLQRSLPTAEAKVQCQEQLMGLLEKFERAQDKAREHQASLHDEVDDRDRFNTEIEQTIEWLKETQIELEKIDPGLDTADVIDRLETQKLKEQDIAVHMEQMRRLIQSQENKYTSSGKELPQEMREKLVYMNELEADVASALTARQEELERVKEDRIEYSNLLQLVKTWLGDAESKIQERIVNIPDCQTRHEELLAEFDYFKKDLDKLRTKGSEIIQQSPDPLEKQVVQRTLKDINRHWLATQAQVAEKSKHLNEADELSKSFASMSEAVEFWISQAEQILHSEPTWNDFDTVRDQLKKHQRLADETEQYQGNLGHMTSVVRQMEQVCDASPAVEKLTHLSQHLFNIRTQTSDKVNLLSDTNQQIAEFEQEVSELRRWMDQTRTHLTMRDTALTIKDQLSVQEKLLTDIDGHRNKADMVVQKHADLKSSMGDASPSQGQNLTIEINKLRKLAEEQYDHLRQAASQQEQYDTDICHLTSAIDDAQDRLMTAPPQASSVQILKKQIADQNALAEQIRSQQQQIKDLVDKSQQLADQCQMLGPMVSQKLEALKPTINYIKPMVALASPRRSHKLDRKGFEGNSHDSGVFLSPWSSLGTNCSVSEDIASISLNLTKPCNKDSISMQSPIPVTTPDSKHEHQLLLKTHSTLSNRRAFQQVDSRDDLTARMKDLVSSLESSASISEADELTDLSLEIPQEPSSPQDWLPFSPYLGQVHSTDPQDASPGARPCSPTVSQHSISSSVNSPKSLSLSPIFSYTNSSRACLVSPRSSTKCFVYRSESSRPLYTPPLMRSISPLSRPSSSVPLVDDSEPSLQDSTDDMQDHSLSSASLVQSLRLTDMGSDRLSERSSSWSSLNLQLGTKDQELKIALQKQEHYQQSVQSVTAKMEQAHSRLTGKVPVTSSDLDKQLKDYTEVLQNIETVKEDIAVVEERGQQIMERPGHDGNKAMTATLSMLRDKLEHLQSLAEDRGRCLQDAVKNREKHEISMTAYRKKVKELENWVFATKIDQAMVPMPTDNMEALKQQADKNKELQDDLNLKLQVVSDMAVQCDSLCEMEPHDVAHKLRSQLTNTQGELGDMKLAAIEKQGPFRKAMREGEKRKKEMEEYEQSVESMQKWINDTKKLTTSPEVVELLHTTEDRLLLQQQLKDDLLTHRELIQMLSTSTIGQRSPLLQSEATDVVPPMSEKDVHKKWQNLSKQLLERTQHLQESMQTGPAREMLPPGYVTSSVLGQTLPRGEDLNDIRLGLAELNDLWNQLQIQVEDRQLRLEQTMTFQQKYQDALQGISSSLDLVECKLFSPDSDKETEVKVKESEDLQREIKCLQNDISSVSHFAQHLLTSASVESRDLIRTSLENLNQRVALLENRAQDQGQELHSVNRHHKQYQDELTGLQSKLSEVKSLMSTPTASSTLNQLITHMQKIEALLKKCESQLEQLKDKSTELSALAPQVRKLSELSTLQSSFMDLHRKAMDKRADLLQSVSEQDQYEKMLEDYAEFLETAQSKLRSDTISAKDLPHLRHQLNTHKDFFSDLEIHRAMLDSLALQCDKTTQQKHQPQHTRLSNLTYVIQDKASLQGQRLERLVQQWTELDEKLHRMQQFLKNVEENVPRPVTKNDTLTSIQEKIRTYRRLQRELVEEKPTVFLVVDKGKQLLHSIHCPTLETAVTDVADKWVDLNTGISQEYKRTESLGDQLQVFDAESAVLRSWLMAANSKLSGLKHVSDTDLQSIGSIRVKVEKLMEFRKEIEAQTELKVKVMSVGNQLIHTKQYDTLDLEDRLKWIEEQWGLLLHDVGKADEYIQQTQMDLMPSRQALTEINSWLDHIENDLVRDKKMPLRSLADVEQLLKKYKGHKVELATKQLTVDFVNQSVQQKTSAEMGSPVPAEKTDFAERLGQLNSRWETVTADVVEQLQKMESTNAKWEEYEKGLGRLQKWLRDQEDKVRHYRLSGHESALKQTLKDCKSLRQSVHNKEADINMVSMMGESLASVGHKIPDCQQIVKSGLENIDTQWRQLDKQIVLSQEQLEKALNLWASYNIEFQSLVKLLTETEYSLNKSNLLAGDLAAIKIQMDNLETLISDVEQDADKVDRFTSLSGQLIKMCEPPVTQELQSTQVDVQNRYRTLQAELRACSVKVSKCLQQWECYEADYTQARQWLDAKEQLCNHLILMRDEPEQKSECLQQSKNLQRDLDHFQSRLATMYQLSDNLTSSLEDATTIANITSQQSGIEHRVLALRQTLDWHTQHLEGDVTQDQMFQQAYDRVREFLSMAENMLGLHTPNRSADEAEITKDLEELKLLLMKFSMTSAELDKLNDLGYRLALNETMSKELQLLNHKWQDLHVETLERSKTLQGILLAHQNFTDKCKTWMLFLKQMEEDLATEICGNLADLTQQQRKCEKFDSDMYSRQQILHAIISDGQKMMAEGDVEDKEEFQQKLHLLAEQWQSVVRRANQRKAIIDNTIKNWHAFNNLSEELRDWLNDQEKVLQSLKFDSCSLQQIKNLLEKTRRTQNEFKLQEDTFRRVHEQGKFLMPRADDNASEEVKVNMTQLQQHWYQLFGRLEEHCGQLEDILRQWQECEDDIEDILTWLKDTRRTLSADLPTTYDELQTELQKCKDIETAFTNSAEKRENLLAKEKNISTMIQPEDLNVLHQRIRLLNKQWDELCQQAALRSQGIKDTMFKWSSLGDRIKHLCDWVDQTELRIINSKEYHIEDMLQKLNKDFKEEIAEKEKWRLELTEQGQRLMKDSSEIRASDIEHRLEKMEDKWQHLKAVISFRQRKLQETLLALQQLDKSMANLRKWLSDMEQSLSTPLVYKQCDIADIQEKLGSQEDLQRDIEHHSAGVGSVLNLCEVLLHDSDACPMETDFNALQAAMKNLDRRWHNICQLSPKRRQRIEETWDLWQTFTDDCHRFEDWLRDVEFELRQTSISSVPSKEETKYYESLQKKIHENLSRLESINRQYRRLAREGRTDTEAVLRSMMQEANDRWDSLQQLVASIMRQLKNTETALQDFREMHTSLYSWFTEIDMQLTNIEHLSSMDIPTKIREMKRLNEEIAIECKKLGYLDQHALFLIQHSDSREAVRVQHELDDIKQYHRQVADRAARYLEKLEMAYDAQFEALEGPEVAPPANDELDLLEQQLYGDIKEEEDDSNFPTSWDLHDIEAYLEASPPESPPEKRRASGQGVLRHSPTESLSRSFSRSPTRSRSSTRSLSPRKSPGKDTVDAGLSREDRWVRMREEVSLEAKAAKWDLLLEKLFEALEDAANHLLQAEEVLRSPTPTGPQLQHPSQNYAQYMTACERSIDNLRSIDRMLKTKTGLESIPSADAQVKSVIQRWETLQAKAIEKDFRIQQQRHDWSQFRADLDGMLAWLDEAEALQSTHSPLPGGITRLEIIIRQHKDFLVQLDNKKARVLSINLTSKHFIHPDTLEGEPLSRKLNEMNHRWDAICNEVTRSQKELQDALMQSQEFHHTVHDLLLWLETMETTVQQCEPIKLGSDESALWSKYRKLMDLKGEMDSTQPRVASLKETADQFLINSESTEMVNAQDKMHIIANRLKSLMRLCSTYISSLEERLKLKDSLSLPPSMDDRSLQLSTPRSRSITSRYFPFSPGLLRTRTRSPFALSRQLFYGMTSPLLRRSAGAAGDNSTGPHEAGSARRRSATMLSRVLRTALPLQLLMLLLLGIASLVPMSGEDYCCDFVNNFRRSLEPMLRYTDGPPPI